jgi:hypothetical protein
VTIISQPQAIQFAAWAAHWAVAQLVRALGIVAGRCPSILASVVALHHVALVTVHGAEGGVDGIAQCGGPVHNLTFRVVMYITSVTNRLLGYNSVVMVAHTAPEALLIPDPTDTGGRPWG